MFNECMKIFQMKKTISYLTLFNFHNVATCKANYIMNVRHSIDTLLTVAHTFRIFNSTGHKLIHIVLGR